MNDGDMLPRHYVEELQCLFNACSSWLFGLGCAITQGDADHASDLVQDTFEAAARTWTTVRDLSPNQQRAWLRSTLTNKAISAFRHAGAFRTRHAAVHARYQETAADTHAQALARIALYRAMEIIESFPERQHMIALMRWQEGMKTSEIAEKLGIAEGTVGAQIHQIRKKLAAELGPYYPFGRDDTEGEAS